MRELAALRMVWAQCLGVGGLDGGGEVSNVVRVEAVGGRAALCADYRNIIERSW